MPERFAIGSATAESERAMSLDMKKNCPTRMSPGHGTGDNVLPIASTSRVFVSSLRKNGYNVEFLEFSGSHHLSRQAADQAMACLTAAFRQRR